jgi:hypothetical protein
VGKTVSHNPNQYLILFFFEGSWIKFSRRWDASEDRKGQEPSKQKCEKDLVIHYNDLQLTLKNINEDTASSSFFFFFFSSSS